MRVPTEYYGTESETCNRKGEGGLAKDEGESGEKR